MEFSELLYVRESCRHFSDRQVEKEKLERILTAASLAPSGCNSQPWHFTVISQEPEKEMLREMIVRGAEDESTKLNLFVREVPVFVVITEEHAKLLPAPEKKYGSQHFAQIDVGLCAAYLTFAAADEGLGSCMIGMFQDEKVKELVGAPHESTVRLVVALGYSADQKAPRKKVRRSIAESVSYGKR
ncbi:MAG: nitroreductase family protein [Christensenella sp.]|nr:nitroreductase family protein [Christensenella sp.]